MTTPSGKMLAVAVREGWMFELDANGYPAALSTAVYEGIEFQGIKSSDWTIPEPRRISHNDATRNLATDFLPSLDPVTGEIRVATLDSEMASALLATKEFTVGEKKGMVWGTDKQGSEIDCALFIVQQVLDRTNRRRYWRNLIVGSARAIPLMASMNDNPSEARFAVTSNPSSSHIWGEAYSVATEGCTEASFDDFMSEDVGKLVAWKGNGIVAEFLFPTNYQATTAAKCVVWVNGVEYTEGVDYDFATDGITFLDASPNGTPASGEMVVAFYEYDPNA